MNSTRSSNDSSAPVSTARDERQEVASEANSPRPVEADQEGRNALSHEECEWVRRAGEGDREAFGCLVDQYHRRAISLAYRLLGHAEDAKDVAQDAFVRAFRSLGQLEDPKKFGGWFMRIVGNLSLNYRRSRRLRRAASTDSVEPFADEWRDPATGNLKLADPEQEDRLQPSELQQAIDAALHRLPEKQRLALILFAVEKVPQKEVAEIMECSVEMVKWNVFQARKKLKDELADYF